MSYHRKRTSTLLREVTSRLYDQCLETGREYLGEVVFLLERQLRQDPAALRRMRPQLLEILAEDDWLVDAAEHFERMQERDRRQWQVVDTLLNNAGRLH